MGTEITNLDLRTERESIRWPQIAQKFGLPRDIASATLPILDSRRSEVTLLPRKDHGKHIRILEPQDSYQTRLTAYDVTTLDLTSVLRKEQLKNEFMLPGKRNDVDLEKVDSLSQAFATLLLDKDGVDNPDTLKQALIEKRGSLVLYRMGLLERLTKGNSIGRLVDKAVNFFARPITDSFRGNIDSKNKLGLVALTANFAWDGLFFVATMQHTGDFETIRGMTLLGQLLASPLSAYGIVDLAHTKAKLTQSDGEIWQIKLITERQT